MQTDYVQRFLFENLDIRGRLVCLTGAWQRMLEGRAYPGRILAVYIREVRLDPGDGRVEKVSDAWDHDVPFVLAADSDVVRHHAAQLGLVQADGFGPA